MAEHKIEHDGEIDCEVNWGWGGLVFFGMLFWWFWAQSGWYRVDCALGVTKACELIQIEYVEKPRAKAAPEQPK